MKRHYQIIYGKDVLAGLEFNPEHMRLQCERELKGKALLLLQRYTETDRNQKKIGVLIAVSITAFLSVFRALLYLKNISIPSGRRELVRATAEHYGIDMQTFIKCLDIKEGLLKFSKEEMRTLFQAYLSEIRKLAQQVDQTICYKQGGGK